MTNLRLNEPPYWLQPTYATQRERWSINCYQGKNQLIYSDQSPSSFLASPEEISEQLSPFEHLASLESIIGPYLEI